MNETFSQTEFGLLGVLHHAWQHKESCEKGMQQARVLNSRTRGQDVSTMITIIIKV